MSFDRRVETIALELLADYQDELTVQERKLIASELARKIGRPDYVRHLEARIARQRAELGRRKARRDGVRAGVHVSFASHERDRSMLVRAMIGLVVLFCVAVGVILRLALKG